MTPGVELQRNRALAGQIAAHLRACDDSFVPLLSERVDLDAFAEKILARAERFEAWSDQRLSGLLAAYCNDAQRRVAFITNVSVVPRCQGLGIASNLLQACIDHVRQCGFERLELEVNAQNTAANRLYYKHGFTIDSARQRTQILQLAV